MIVLVDPYISRLNYGEGGHPDDERPHFAREDLAWSDTTLIDSLITEADFILCTHSHFDHLADVPYIARKTGAKVIGHETANTILRAYGIPEEQLYTVKGGEDYQFEDFSVRVVPGLHSALNEKLYYDSRRYDEQTGLQAPLRINQFIEGGSLNFLARFDRHTVLAMGSMNFIEGEFEGSNRTSFWRGSTVHVSGSTTMTDACSPSPGSLRSFSRLTGTTSGSPTGSRSRRTSNGTSSRSSRRHAPFLRARP